MQAKRISFACGFLGILATGFSAGCGSMFAASDIDPHKVMHNLRSPDVSLRRGAVESLVELATHGMFQRSPKGDRFIRDQIQTLAAIVCNKEEDPEVRGQIVRAMAIVSERKPIDQRVRRSFAPFFVRLLLDEKEPEEVRSWIAMCLSELVPPETAASAIMAVAQSKNANVRSNATLAWGRLNLEPEQLLKLADVAVGDPEPYVRKSGFIAAAKLAKQDKRARDLLRRGTADRDDKVRGTVIWLMKVIGMAEKPEKK